MSNHVHILLKEGQEDIGRIMKRIVSSYVYWYNWKYERSGHLFQDRYKSEPVEQDGYLWTVLRYIHQNPVKAGLCKAPAEYPFSSYHEYIGKASLTNTELVYDLLDNNRQKAVERFSALHTDWAESVCLKNEEHIRLNDEKAKAVIAIVCKVKTPKQIQEFTAEQRNTYLKTLKEKGLSIRQIERLTGINRGIVHKA
jgi:hypothetical protein